jgi:hypothetical protein
MAHQAVSVVYRDSIRMARFLGFTRIPGTLLGLCAALVTVSVAAQQARHPPLAEGACGGTAERLAPHRVGEVGAGAGDRL